MTIRILLLLALYLMMMMASFTLPQTTTRKSKNLVKNKERPGG